MINVRSPYFTVITDLKFINMCSSRFVYERQGQTFVVTKCERDRVSE